MHPLVFNARSYRAFENTIPFEFFVADIVSIADLESESKECQNAFINLVYMFPIVGFELVWLFR